MVTLNQNEKRVVEQFRKLPPERRRHVILAMLGGDEQAWKRHRPQAEPQLRAAAKAAGLDWDRLSDDERQDFISRWIDEKPR